MMHDHQQAAGAFSILDWFAGNGRYMTLWHCMDHDTLWVAITIALDVTVAIGYCLIALHWYRNEKRISDGPAKNALRGIRNVFIFCGLCGYIFIPIKMYWPAWRLYDGFMLVLAYFTWKYAWGARQLKVLYSELNNHERLASDLQASRAESEQKTFFLNAISHDLRTPLNGLLLQADLAALNLDSGDREGVRESLGEIKTSAKAAADLLTSILELGRLDRIRDPLKLEPIHLHSLANTIIATHQAAAIAKGLELCSKIPPDMVIHADRLKLERVLVNLIGNAVKFTEIGQVTVRATRSDSQLVIEVADTGVGIPPEHQGSIFNEFFQVNNRERDRKKGFGLGLAIARRLARHLGGDLDFTTEPGRGSTFRLTLPASAAAPATAFRAADDVGVAGRAG